MVSLSRTRSSVLERARLGHADEFARLYTPFAYLVALKRGVSVHDAEDVSQQTMLELLKKLKLPDFRYDRSKGSLKGMIKTIVRRRIADLFRGQRDEAGKDVLDRLADDSSETDSLVEREWLKTHWLAALDRVRGEVKPTTFQSFQLCVLSEWSIEDVADTLGLTPNQVSQNKGRVIRRLREHFMELQRDNV